MMTALRRKALLLKLPDDEASVVTDRYIMQTFGRFAVVVGLILALGACAETELAVHTAKQITTADSTPSGGHYKVGNPYQVAGTWYYPQEDYKYEETGIASWYGPGFHGRKTANGEIFDQNALTAAHRTLPLPSVVQVTNLQNGRSITLRVNDRGPFSKNRIIDVSRKAAQLLGFEAGGTAKVRVTILPAESQRAAGLMEGGDGGAGPPPAVPVEAVMVQSLSDSDELAAAPSSSESRRQTARLPSDAAMGGLQQGQPEYSLIFVQVGAFGSLHNAERLRARISSLGSVKVSEKKTGSTYLFRVRVGPIDSVDDADRLVSRLHANDFTDAQIVLE
jgi:rare lipoprotein A